MNNLILYTRLTGYWMACMRYDHKHNGNSYLVYRTAPSKDAPFKMASEAGINLNDFDSADIQSMRDSIALFKPDFIYVAGWSNKQYLSIVKHYKIKGIPVITGMDNHWLGSVKQYVASIFGRWFLGKYFTHVWVPGQPQYFYAKKLGFKPHQILTGLYCADETIFKSVGQTEHHKQFLFVGRIVAHKGVQQLFEVVKALIAANQFNIKLHIIGSGPLEHLIPKHQNIKHTPFVAPEALPEMLRNAGTFILPSLYEAWGVVVHEAALAGLPIITTNQCGAGTAFVEDGLNGYIYDAYDTDALKQIVLQTIAQDETSYFSMSKNSKQIASKITLADWSTTINSFKKWGK